MVKRPKTRKARKQKSSRSPSTFVDKNSSAFDALSALKQLESFVYDSEPSVTTPVGNKSRGYQSVESGDITLDERTGSVDEDKEVDLDGRIENIHQKIDYERKLTEQAVDLKLQDLKSNLFEKVAENRDSIKNWFIGISLTIIGLIIGSVYFGMRERNSILETINVHSQKITSNEAKLQEFDDSSNHEQISVSPTNVMSSAPEENQTEINSKDIKKPNK